MMQTKLTARLLSDKNLVTALEVFAAIAETRQVTKAARLLGITQSAASQQLASLEEACDAQLVDRSVRPLRLTQAGELCLRHAQRILNSIEDLATSMRHEGPHPISVLRVGMLASIATTRCSGRCSRSTLASMFEKPNTRLVGSPVSGLLIGVRMAW